MVLAAVFLAKVLSITTFGPERHDYRQKSLAQVPLIGPVAVTALESGPASLWAAAAIRDTTR